MSEEHNERKLFEGNAQFSKPKRGADRRKKLRRKSDVFFTILKYACVALMAALLVKCLR